MGRECTRPSATWTSRLEATKLRGVRKTVDHRFGLSGPHSTHSVRRGPRPTPCCFGARFSDRLSRPEAGRTGFALRPPWNHSPYRMPSKEEPHDDRGGCSRERCPLRLRRLSILSRGRRPVLLQGQECDQTGSAGLRVHGLRRLSSNTTCLAVTTAQRAPAEPVEKGRNSGGRPKLVRDRPAGLDVEAGRRVTQPSCDCSWRCARPRPAQGPPSRGGRNWRSDRGGPS